VVVEQEDLVELMAALEHQEDLVTEVRMVVAEDLVVLQQQVVVLVVQ
jgi:hypothetical protein